MSAVAYVDKGKIVETTSQSSLSNSVSDTGKSDMNKDTFLQLLVAQMKYQDPLEPTSNTEYISQYATFSQVEQMQNMSASMELQRASTLVGQEVIIETQRENGSTATVQGKVDFVTYENNKAYVSVNDNLYAVGDVTSIVDKTYMDAYGVASDLVNRIAKLPNVNNISNADVPEINALSQIYNGMNDYERTFVAGDAVKALQQYVTKAAELALAAETAKKAKEAEEAAAAKAAEEANKAANEGDDSDAGSELSEGTEDGN